jgi:HSP20 family molecular chaperone IbpA
MEKKPERQKVVAAPYVDIYEKGEELVLMADMPGVDEKSANVTVENGLLTIEGDIAKELDEGLYPLRSERRADVFRRTFDVSDAIDTPKITANMKHGVLTIKLPRREERKSRKIQISAA